MYICMCTSTCMHVELAGACEDEQKVNREVVIVGLPEEPQWSEEDEDRGQHLLTQMAHNCNHHHTSIKPA